MRTSVDRRVLPAVVVALLLPLAALVSSGCGGAAQTETSATSPQAGASAPATLDVAGTLLVVRHEEGAWKLVRLTPASGAEQTLGALPFKPRQALASPSGAHVLYLGERSRLAVVDAATGAVQRIALAGLPIRAIDGATWTSENRFLFGGSRRTIASPQYSFLYHADLRAGTVARFRSLAGGEPSYAAKEGSLIYVTRRRVGDNAKEVIWRLRSLTARPHVLECASAYVDAGRSFDAPLLSPNGLYVLSSETGTDVRVTYSLTDVRFPDTTMWQSRGASLSVAAWDGAKVAFQQVQPQADGGDHLAVFLYDTSDDSLTHCPCPDASGVGSFDWSPEGDLAGFSRRTFDEGEVYASSASNLGEWVDLGAGIVPVWVQ